MRGTIEGRGWPTLGAIVGAVLAGAAAVLMAGPLSDNSFFTHLATGRLILASGQVPGEDPYSYTAAGAPWVVQSWVASLAFATLEAVGGLGLVRLSFGATGALLMAMSWVLLRPAATLLPRLAVATLFLVAGSGAWAERPLMLGLVAFTSVALVAEGRLDPRWLLPAGWVWANAHGSFPLAFVYLAARWLGARVAGEDAREEVRAARWLALGALSGVIGPLGTSALTFPMEMLGRQDVLRHVVEWQAPEFTSVGQRAFLAMVVVAIVGLARSRCLRDAIPSAVFIAAALVGSRNIAVACIVLLAPIARAVPAIGSLTARVRPRAGPLVLAAVIGAAVVALGARLGERDLDLRAYPVASLGFLEGAEVDLRDDRLAAREAVGNLMTMVYGSAGVVFYDDRFDMYPRSVSDAALALNSGEPPMLSELDRREVVLVLAPSTSATTSVLAREPTWRSLLVEEQWQLFCRRGAEIGEPQQRC